MAIIVKSCTSVQTVHPQQWKGSAFVVQCFNHPPYSSDLAPNDFFLFPKIKIHIKGQHFDDILDNIPKKDFSDRFTPYDSFVHCTQVG